MQLRHATVGPRCRPISHNTPPPCTIAASRCPNRWTDFRLLHQLDNLPNLLSLATTVEAIEALLPWNLKPILDARRRRQQPASQIDSP